MNHLALSIVVALVVAAAPGSPAQAAANLLANPGFESSGGSYDGWFTFGSGPQISTGATDDIFRSGAAAAKIFGEFTNCPGGQFDVGGFGQTFTPVPGQEYRLSGWTFMSSADPLTGTDTCNENRLLAKIVFFDSAAGGAELSSNEIIIGDGTFPLNRWIPFSVIAPAPAGAARVEALFLFLQPACDGGSMFVDDASFCEVTPDPQPNVLANPSFDTDLLDWDTFGNVFHESQSFAVHTRTGSAKMFSTFNPGFDSGMTQAFPAAPGSAWKMDLYAMTTCFVGDAITGANDNQVLARIEFRDSGAAVGGTDMIVLDADAPLGTWRKRSLVAVAPAGADSVAVYILFSSPTQMGGSAYVDDVMLGQIAQGAAPVIPDAAGIRLLQNAPNPVRAGVTTRIEFGLERPEAVRLSVYDVTGRLVAELVDAPLPAGPHRVAWDGRGRFGPVAAGIYRYVLRTSSGQVARSLVLVD